MTTETERLELRYIALDTLVRWDRNPKRHDIGAIASSIARHGFKMPPRYEPTLNDGAGGIVAGNGRADTLAAMRAQGLPAPRGVEVRDGAWYVPVLFGVDAPSRAAAEAFGLDDNNLTMAGGEYTALDMSRMWESEGYLALLADLAKAGALPVTVDGDDLDTLLQGLTEETLPQQGAGGDDFDASPVEGPTRTALGDLWIIDGGRHRLVVGDSTDPATVARLMGGERATAVITDPPYGIKASGMTMGSGQSSKPRHDRLSYGQAWDGERPTLTHLLSLADWLCFWGGNYFTDVLPPTNHWLCWYKKNDGLSFSEFELAWTNYGRQTRHLSHHWGGEAKEHITQKPLEVIIFSIEQCPDPSRILDPYLGSGTSIVAAHRTGRRCFGIEISPIYADICLRRAEAEGLPVERAADA